MWKRIAWPLAGLSLSIALIAAMRGSSETPAPADPPKANPVEKPPAAAVKSAANKVTAVTVYPNSALVTREIDVPPGAGSVEVVVTPIPPTVVDSSMYAEGSDALRVLTTRFRKRAVMADSREEVRKIQESLKQLQITKDKVESDIKAIQSNVGLLTKLEGFTSVNVTHSAEKGALNSENAIALSKFVMETRTEKSREVVGMQQQIADLTEKMEFANRQLRELAATGSRVERDAVLVVDRNGGAGGKVRLNYLVEGATWRPMYKFRAGKTAKDQIRLEYLAAVLQNSGEDWSNVNLVLSTAQPRLNANSPELHVLNVGVVPRTAANPQPNTMALEEQSRTLRGKAQKDFNEKKASDGTSGYNSAAALDQSWELLNPDAALKRGCALAVTEGPTVTYHLAASLTVPSRQDEQVLEVARIDMPPDYYYKAVPVLTSHVYRQAELTNRSAHVLLPGEATMFIGSDFVGQMNVPLVAVGERFTVGFGVDPQLQVQRAMVDRSRTTQGGNQALKFDYRILISSYKSERIRLQVWDRLPHAETDAVSVSLVKAMPDLSKDAMYLREQRNNNLLRWDVDVDPGATGEKASAINYEFKMELDRQMSIGGFQSAAAIPTMSMPDNMPAAQAALNPADEARIKAAMAQLSAEDRRIAESQVFCAIDPDSRLGEMGPILKVMCKGTPVFLCCKGCEKAAKANPDEALRKLQQLMAKRGRQ